MSAGAPKLESYVALSPAGKTIVISPELFDAIESFTDKKMTGSVEVQFRDGGVAGVEVRYRMKKKRQSDKNTS